MAKRLAKKVLILGWDAADWKIIHKLIDAGEMPYLEKLINQGVMGNLATLQPILSPMLWSSITTGKRADKHGIYGFTEPKPDGSGVRPVTSTSLKAQPMWNIIEDHGLKSAVVGWFATHPANAIQGTVVSNQFHQAKGRGFGEWPMAEHTCSPESLKETLRDLRVHPNDISSAQILSFVPDAANVDQEKDKRLTSLTRLLAQCFSVHAAGTHIAENEEWDMLAVYFDTIDRVCHEFMEFYPPKMPQINDDEYERYKGVIDQVYRFHDLMLGRYMKLVGPETTIMIVSDHGFFSDHLRPAGPAGGPKKEPVRWHREYGIIVASGPGIKKDDLVFGASLLDIAPTTLSLLGIPVAKDMEGRALTQMFDEVYKPDFVDSYGAPPNTGQTADEEDPWAAQQLLEQFAALGYVEEDDDDDDGAKAVEQAIQQKLSNLSEVFLSIKEYAKAAPLLEDLLQRKPDSFATKLSLAQCRLHLGDYELCKKTVDEILGKYPRSAWGHMLAGMLVFKQGDQNAALDHFKQAEVTGRNLPQLHTRMGQVYLQQEQWAEAHRAFNSALEIDGDSHKAYRGLGIAMFHQKHFENAMENLLRSVALKHFQPRTHYYLALAFVELNDMESAERVLLTVLKLKPEMISAHETLAMIYNKKGNDAQVLFHRSQAKNIRKKESESA